MNFNFPKLNLPLVKFKLKSYENSHFEIWDVVRKKYIVLTPEEWVRQHWVHLLHSQYGYPLGLISVEKQVSKKSPKDLRFDIVCYNNLGKQVILIECKAYEVPINQKTLNQALTYNYHLNIPYIILSNGYKHELFTFRNKQIVKIKQLPHYSEL